MARGLSNPVRRLSEDAVAALERGDIDELMRLSHAEFGSAVMMADDDDDGDDDDDDGGSGGADDDDDDDTGKSKGKKKSKDDGEEDDDDDDDVAEQLAAMRKRMKAADKRADKTEATLRDLQRKDTPDAEKAQEDLQEAQEQVRTLTETVNTLRLENAFLTANENNWHDPDVALSIARSKGYLEDVVDEDGEVDRSGLKKALKRLAKEHKYLVAGEKPSKKRKDDDSDDDDDDDDDDLPESGSSAGRRSDNGKDAKARRQQLQGRFPILNR